MSVFSDRLKIKVEAEVDKYVDGLSEAEKKLIEFAAVAEAKDKVFKQFNDQLTSGVMGVVGAISKLGEVASKAYDQANEGAKILSAQAFFKQSGKDIESYRSAIQGMVSDAKLMKKANLADSMGIDEETFKVLANVASKSAQKTGQSFEYMFDSIIVGTARASRLLLDNLGIIVSVEQANRNYAIGLGIADDKLASFVKTMTAEEKQLAFVKEVRKQSTSTLLEAAEVGETASVKFEKVNAQIENMTDAWKTMMAELVATQLGERNESLVSYFTKTFKAIQDDAKGFVSYMKDLVTLAGERSVAGMVLGGISGAIVGGVATGGAGIIPGAVTGAKWGAGLGGLGGLYEGATAGPYGGVDPDQKVKDDLVEKANRLAGELAAEPFAEGVFGQIRKAVKLTDADVQDLEMASDATSKKMLELRKTLEELGNAKISKGRTVGDAIDFSDLRGPKDRSGSGGGKKTNKEKDLDLDKLIRDSEKSVKENAEWEKKYADNMLLAKQSGLSLNQMYGDRPRMGRSAADDEARQKRIKAVNDEFNKLLEQDLVFAMGAASNAVGGFAQLMRGDFLSGLDSLYAVATEVVAALNPIAGAVMGFVEALVKAFVGATPISDEAAQRRAEQEAAVADWNWDEVFSGAADAWYNTWHAFDDFVADEMYRGVVIPYEDAQRLKELAEHQTVDEANREWEDYQNRAGKWEVPGQSETDQEKIRAQEENTEAIRDLIREFRNLPQSYKVNRAIYDSDVADRPLGTALEVSYNIFNEGR